MLVKRQKVPVVNTYLSFKWMCWEISSLFKYTIDSPPELCFKEQKREVLNHVFLLMDEKNISKYDHVLWLQLLKNPFIEQFQNQSTCEIYR